MTEEELAPYVQYALSTFDTSPLPLITEEALRDFVKEELLNDWALNEEATCAKRHELFGIANTQPKDFRTKLLNYQGLQLMAGIRHFNLQNDQAFVHLTPSGVIDDSAWPGIQQLLAKEFAMFAPKNVRIWAHPNAGYTEGLNVQTHQKWLVGDVAKIQLKELPTKSSDISLLQIWHDDYFETYLDYYAAFHDAKPEFKDAISVNDKATMEQSRKDGLLYWIMLNNKRIGLIAGEKESFSVYFNEIVLHPKYKGLGYATIAQRKFINHLSHPIQLVWGAIDHQNIPSTKTALRVGRKVVRKECFVGMVQKF